MKYVLFLCALLLLCGGLSVRAQWSTDSGANIPICTATNTQNLPTIVSDSAGGAIITWYDDRDSGSTGQDIYAQKVNTTGMLQWTPNGVPICRATGAQDLPTILSNGAGGAIITWRDLRGGSDYDIYTQKLDAAGVVQWTANGVAISTAINGQNLPTIVSDAAGGAIITWEDHRSGTNYDIYAQKVSARGIVQWMANGVVISAETGDQIRPAIVSDGAGGAIITWRDFRSGSDTPEIYAQHVNDGGVVQWTANGVAICTATSAKDSPTIVSDGAGGAIIAWDDLRSTTNYDIYAEKVNAAGAVQWTANGVAICSAASLQLVPAIVSDGAGGAIITWDDLRTGMDYDIYAQKVDAAGVVQWSANGVAISTATGLQGLPTIVSDGAAGAIITWEDYRSKTNSDIYAQRVLLNGTLEEVTGVNEHASFLPKTFELEQNFPNPFNPSTHIQFTLPRSEFVTLRIFNLLGEQVAVLISETLPAGAHQAQWDARGLPSGVYFCRLHAGELVQTRKLLLQK